MCLRQIDDPYSVLKKKEITGGEKKLQLTMQLT